MGYSVPARSSSEANRSRNNNDTVRAIEYLGELKEADNREKEAQREKNSIILKLRALNLSPEQKALIEAAIKGVE